jgi:hypothetical protein
MTEVPLSRGRPALIDDADLPLVEGKRWWPLKAKVTSRGEQTVYAVTRLPGGG